MPKLWKLLRGSSKANNNNNNDNNNNSSNNEGSNSNKDINDNNNEINNDISNNEALGSNEIKNHDKRKKSLEQDEKENLNNLEQPSLIHNRLVLQEFIELQKGIANEVVYLGDEEPKDVLMKVDLLGVRIYDKDNPKILIKDFEVEQIIQYSYERDEQILTLSYMNSEYSVESYDFVTPDYFEIFDFIGHVIAMVIKMNNQKYETEEEANDSDDLNNFQLPRISVMYKSSDSTNIFSPTFILNNFMPENNQSSSGYLDDSKEDVYSSSACLPSGNDMFHESMTLINDKDIFLNKETKGSVDDVSSRKNKINDKNSDVINSTGEYANSTPNLSINTNAHRFENEFRRNYIITSPKSAIENKTPLSDAFGFEKDSSKVLGYKKLGGDNDSENYDKRSSYQCRTVRHINSGKFDASEIPAYGTKYGTIHFRKSHDIEEMYSSELILNTQDSSKEQNDKNHESISNQTQAKVNIMKYFVENRYNIDKKKSYSSSALLDSKDENEVGKYQKQEHQKRKDNSDNDLSTNIDSSRDTVETSKDDDKKKHKNRLHISKTNINKACEEISPSIDAIDEVESPTKKSSSKKLKIKYNFSRPKSLQLNFLSYNKDQNKKRISIKNPGDISDIYTPSPVDGESTLESDKLMKTQKRRSNMKKSKKIFSSNKKYNEEQENEKNDNELSNTIPEDESDSKAMNKSSNTVQYYNPITDEIEDKPIDDIRNSLYGLPKIPSNNFEIGEYGEKNESELLSAYLEAYSSSPGSKVYSAAVSTIKSQNDSRLSKTYPKEFINSISENGLSPISNESNFDYFVNEPNWVSLKESSSYLPLDDDQDARLIKNSKKTKSFIDGKSNSVDNKYISGLKNLNNSYKSEEIINLDLNIIKDQYKDSMSKSSNCLNDVLDDKLINDSQQHQVDVNNNQHQQLHKYKTKQVINYRTIHGVSPFVTQGNSSTLLSNTQLNSDRNSTKGKQAHNDIYSTFKKFVGKNQKPKTSINEISFTNGAPENEENKLPQIEKEYENGKEILIRTLKDNHYEVTAGTVHGLINEMILNNSTDIMFIDIFLLTYRHFLKANDLVLLLTEEYNKLIKKVDEIDETDSNNDVILQIQKVASFIKKWVAEYFNDFLMSNEALKNLNLLIEEMKNSDKAQCKSYVNQINTLIKYEMKESEEEKVDEIEIPDKYKNLTYEIDYVDILSIASKKIAQQLTLVDIKLWMSIKSQEYAHFLWDSKDVKEKNTKNIQRFIERFNQISFWVSTMICRTQSPKNRTNVLEKMIKVAKYCLEIQNFNTTMAILSGLNMAAVSRLKSTWMTLSTKTMNVYAEIEEAMSYKCNFKNYRELEYNSKPPLIPFFGLLLKDLTFMNDGNQKILKNELVNFQKLRLIYTKIKSLNLIQIEYNFQEDNSVIETTKLNPTESNNENIVKHEIEMFEYFKILPHYTETALLEFSRKIENSNAKAFNTIMVAKPTPSKTISDTEKTNTSKNPSLIELFQQ